MNKVSIPKLHSVKWKNGGELRLLPAPKSEDYVIERLERCLEMAKKEAYNDVVVVMGALDGRISFSWETTKNQYVLLGGLDDVKMQILHSLDE